MEEQNGQSLFEHAADEAEKASGKRKRSGKKAADKGSFDGLADNDTGAVSGEFMMDGIDIPDVPMVDTPGTRNIIEDECKVAFRFAFIGIGQAGNRIVEAFWRLGYRRVCAVNTTQHDLAGIQIPEENKLVMDIGTGGAGKDPNKGLQAAKQYSDSIYDLMTRCFGEEVDKIFVCGSGGGGTGSGGFTTVLGIAREMLPKTVYGDPGVGAILALPKPSEGPRVNLNAYEVFQNLLHQVGNGRGKMDGRVLTPLILVDNERVEKTLPDMPIAEFWKAANGSVAGLLHLFNSICCQDSDMITFDKADFQDMLGAGVVSFGACRIGKFSTSTEVAQGIRDGLKNSLLVGGAELSEAMNVGCVFVSGEKVLETLPQGHVEYAFEMMARHLKVGGVLHKGVYKGRKDGLYAYVLMGEMDKPRNRLVEIAVAAGYRRG